MPGRRVPTENRDAYWKYRGLGHTMRSAADLAGVAERTAHHWEKHEPTSGDQVRIVAMEQKLPRPKLRSRTYGHAKEALDDFAKFRRRYLGRNSTPWQEEAAHDFLKWLNSSETEYVIVNCPPGSGKSTLFTMDIPLWMIARDRTFRGFLGHRTAPKAAQYAGRLRRVLELTAPLKANEANGRMYDAEGCMAVDYGRFKPSVNSLPWRMDEFTVEQMALRSHEDKEPTIMSAGMETEFLGTRSGYVVWDDLVTERILRNPEQVEHQRQWYEVEAETRVEPGGLLVLCGQRMGPNDLYAHTREMVMVDDDDNIVGKKYRHIIYPVHFEDRCKGEHGRNVAKSYPQGCILDTSRYHWSGPAGLGSIRKNREAKYQVQYQQRDVDPAGVLVPVIWINGGTDPETQEHFPGCWDNDRALAEIPRGLAPPLLSVCTADPSPTKYWAIQWWLVSPSTNQRFLLDQIRQSMDAPDFLDWNANAGVFHGVVQEWQERSRKLGAPITHWIVENNAAQRFLLQYDHVLRWTRANGVQVIGHQTHMNKLSEEFGIQMLANLYRFGQVRLPGKGNAKPYVLHLVQEATQYPQALTDDCLMAQWFLEFNLPTIEANWRSENDEDEPLWRPSWMKVSA